MKKLIWPLLLVLTASSALASPIGTWRTADGQANVQIRRCGRDLCGTTAGKPVLKFMRPTGRNLWTGTISDVRSGDQYDGTISLLNQNALKIHGCVPDGGMCGDQTWTRLRSPSHGGAFPLGARNRRLRRH